NKVELILNCKTIHLASVLIHYKTLYCSVFKEHFVYLIGGCYRINFYNIACYQIESQYLFSRISWQ
ncbi:hypothetical protein, partial [Brevibacillus sp. SYSU BS000544]|uniref:hypothetical protein n=1 Tax=Brevibacillus sp. SYSU BS000544 TaxID=3416443 RepID=UPI003CE50624